MKKNISCGAVALALLMGIALTYDKTDESLSELQLANAEALAEVENNYSECPTQGDGCYAGYWLPTLSEHSWN